MNIPKSTRTSVTNVKDLRFPGRFKSQRIKQGCRQLLSALMVYSLVFVPLLMLDPAMPKAFGRPQTCDGPDSIFQGCPLNGTVEDDLTSRAIDDVIAFYNLQSSDRSRVMKYARNEVRAMLYPKILELIKKQSPTADEQAALDAFAARIKARRVLAAQKAQEEYNKWTQLACVPYVPPSPYTYNPGSGCYQTTYLFNGGPKPPTFEEFQQFGAAIAYGDLYTPAAQDVSDKTTNGIIIGVGAGAAAIGGIVGTTLGATVTFGALSAIFPFGGITISAAGFAVVPSASAASGTVGAIGVGGPAAIIVATLVVLVLQSINIANQSQLPGKLQQAIIDAQAQTINLRDLTTTDTGNQELYVAFLLATLPDYPGADVPPVDPNDRKLIVRQNNLSGTTESSTIMYKDWDGTCHTTRLSGAWFIDSKNGVEKQTLSIRYLDWNLQKKIASRKGGQFIITTPNDVNRSELADEISYSGCGQNQLAAKIKFEQLTLLSQETLRVNCGLLIIDPDPGQNVILGSISGAGDSPSTLTVTVNDGGSATVNNITVRNLAVNSDYQITANIVSGDAPTPTTPSFTLKVRNSVGQEQSNVIAVKKTAVINTLPSGLPTDLNVGDDYSVSLDGSSIPLSCFGYSYSVTGGALPLGTSLQHQNLQTLISGRLLSGGKYTFTIGKNYANRESVSQSYTIFVKSNLANLANGLVSWWRAEEGANDFTGAHNGTVVGNVGFAEGKVNRAFKFDGTNSYIALPDDTFSPSLDFTFETWFKTGMRGVILGQQRIATPYDTPQFGSRPAIYIDQNGKLSVQMFFDQNNTFTTSPTRVDDNQFHHVAVTYLSSTHTRTVFLDGERIGSFAGPQDASPQKYQLGTGYVNDGYVGGLTGWFTFNGLIDEPTLFNRVLSDAEINEIFIAGGAGKISVDVLTIPPLQRDGSDAAIEITARGGTPPLNYSIDGGNSYQDTSSFRGLIPGSYPVVVKDASGRTVERSATIVNPPPNLSLTTLTKNPTCHSVTNGEIRIIPSGLTGSAEFSVLGGANKQTSNVFTDLPAGTFTPWVHDLNSDTFFTGDALVLTQPTAISVSPVNFVNGAINVPYSHTFTLSGGNPPFTITAQGTDFNNGYALPDGLVATADGNSITISGTPQQVGTFPILIMIGDQNGCNGGTRNFPLTITATQTYGLSGRVTNGGQGLANVTVSFSGASSGSTATDAAGNYSLNSLAGSGNYTITASLNGYTFAQALTYNSLNANYTDANIATATTTYEGDIAGRPNGDGSVNVLDLVALGRIRNNLDTEPAIGAEWQRTDIAPRSSLGNGVIDDSDITQMRNYIVATNPLTPAGGAITSSSPGGAADRFSENSLLNVANATKLAAQFPSVSSTTISAGSVSVSGGGATVPITLNTDGDVEAVQFTVTYDSAKLNLTSITNGQNLPPGITIITNTSIPGKVNVLAYKPLDGSSVFPAGDIQLLRLSFSVVQNAIGNAAIGFSDSPTQRIASDPQANAITLNSNAGNVSITTVYGISGKITSGGQGLANVFVVRRVNFQDTFTFTDASGNYSFNDLTPDNSYTITPSRDGYTFTPGNRTYLLTSNISNADFSSAGPTAATSAVSGRISDDRGRPLSGAVVRLDGSEDRMTITDNNGFYHFDKVETNGFYVVTPARANFSFSPAERAFSGLGAQTEASFTATPDGMALNPLDTTEYFVRQQYLDFLGREPDEAGFNFWVNNIEACANDVRCREAKRTDTSAAFFLSIEFQQTGYLVYRTYRVAYGDMPGAPVPLKLEEFKPDTAEIGRGVVVNQSGWEQKLAANKEAYMAEFVQRPRFTAAYPATMTPAEFVDELFRNAKTAPSPAERAGVIAEFGSATTSADATARTRAFLEVAENPTVTRAEFNRAFVLMQYFGYLRRDPNVAPDADFSGYNFWLHKLNDFGGDFRNAEMVKAFLVAAEYRERFPRN